MKSTKSMGVLHHASDIYYCVSITNYSVIMESDKINAIVSVLLITMSLHHAKRLMLHCQCQWLPCHCTMQSDRCYGVSVTVYSAIAPCNVTDAMVSVITVSLHLAKWQMIWCWCQWLQVSLRHGKWQMLWFWFQWIQVSLCHGKWQMLWCQSLFTVSLHHAKWQMLWCWC